MKTLFAFVFLGLVLICCEDSKKSVSFEEKHGIKQDFLPESPDGFEWDLIWNDEFEGNVLDSAKWSHVTWSPPGVDQPRKDGFWREDAAVLDGAGLLRMLVYHDEEKERFIDGAIRTKGLFEKTYGYFEAKIKLQESAGHWSAFWLMGDGVGLVGNEGIDGTEIDIMEKINPFNDEVYQTLHWDGYGDAHQSAHKIAAFPNVTEGFHTFGLWWSKDEYKFYIDGINTWSTRAGGVCQVPLYIKISDEVGKWAGSIQANQLPDIWYVDYVRVFDLKKK